MTIFKLCERGLTVATFFSLLCITKKPPAMKLQAAALLIIFWFGIFTVHLVKGSVGSQPMRKLSCVSLSTQKLNIRNLVSYEKQEVPVNAIMFITKKGIRICVSPENKWVQAAVRKIDRRRTISRK
ncbi:LOW QUALITY PROTEIN: lymphotactin-like [Heliangelus exortis]|uniref:LOW QUALITY PROTEIN: lymphotactin-like n=1 Tax=Heliangelus exortis TaxID=472823 RepID=UPI003A8E1F02